MKTIKIPQFYLIIITSILILTTNVLNCQVIPINSKTLDEYSFKLIQDKKISISPYLLGFNAVYSYEADSIWSDGKIEGYLKDINTSVMRYPGGTVVTFYHWNALTGEGHKDSWDPANPVTPLAKSEYMDLDEFISLAKRINITPLLGINMSSGRKWNRLEDGLKEAIELMKYCKAKKFNVKYWFLDNEPYQKDGNGGAKTIEEYATLINLFATRMKEFDPNIKIIANWNSAFINKRDDYQKLLSIAGKNIDIIDAHWYWSWNNPTFEKWLSKTPMAPFTGKSYSTEIAYFRQMVKDFGYPNIKLASLEWNVGPIKEKQLTPHQCALIQSEMLMQFMSGGLDMATFWPLQGAGAAVSARSFVNRSDRSAHPDYQIFKFMGKIQGTNIFKNEVVKDHPNVLTFTSADKTGNVVRICFLNKNQSNINVNVETDLFKNMKLTEASSYVLKDGGTDSEIKTIKLLKQSENGVSFPAAETSFTMLTFQR